jgi:hypothetical protein
MHQVVKIINILNLFCYFKNSRIFTTWHSLLFFEQERPFVYKRGGSVEKLYKQFSTRSNIK